MKVQVYEWLRIIQPLTAEFTRLLILPQANGFIDFSIKYFKGTNIGLAYCPNRLYINYLGCFKFVDNDNLQPTIGINTISIKDSDISINGNITSNIRGYKKVDIYAYQNTEADIAISDIKQDNGIFKPCKLLAPYQNHPAGECAMIDVLTNTLYFNQGTGAFTCEGEAGEVIDTTPASNQIVHGKNRLVGRLREWLTNIGYAYIDTGYVSKATTNAKVVTKRSVFSGSAYMFGARQRIGVSVAEDLGKLTMFSEIGVQGGYDKDGNHLTYEETGLALRVDIGKGNSISSLFKFYELNKKYTLEVRGNDAYFNGEYWYTADIGRTDGKYPIAIFAINTDGEIEYVSKNVYLSEVEIDNIHLYPFELSEQYIDNAGVIHPKGECCLLDVNSSTPYFKNGTGSLVCDGGTLGIWQDNPCYDVVAYDASNQPQQILSVWADAGDRLRLIWEKNLPFTTHRWLKGDGRAWIKTDIVFPQKPLDYSFKVYNLEPAYTGSDERSFIAITNRQSSQRVPIIHVNPRADTWTYHVRMYRNEIISMDNNPLLCTGTTNGSNIGTAPLQMFYADTMSFVPWSKWRGMISEVFIDTLHLSPAVLDRPTLATEDNNGISRKQGEAVLVDEERYKQGLPWVFGNIASSGKFEVSDYLIYNQDFEIIGGLRSDGNQYIDTLQIINETRTDLEVGFCDLIENTIENDKGRSYSYLMGTRNINESNTYDQQAQIVFDRNGKMRNNYSGQGKVGYITFPPNCVLRTDWANGVTYYNDVAVANEKSVSDISQEYSLVLFTSRTHNGGILTNLNSPTAPAKVVIYKFSLMDVASGKKFIDLIPIRLKKSIESYTTHNGKGGSLGEYCFFDKISGKAFVNNGSGKFRRYFQEGVDYERIAGVRGTGRDTSINLGHYNYTSNFAINAEIVDSGNSEGYSARVWAFTNVAYSASPLISLVQDNGTVDMNCSISGTLKNYGRVDISGSLTTECTSQYVDFGGARSNVTDTLQYHDTDLVLYNFNVGGSRAWRGTIKSFKYSEGSTTILNLQPIRLLKPAYESDTHNGKAYPAGTICFLNLLDGVIYGNDGEGEFSEYVP